MTLEGGKPRKNGDEVVQGALRVLNIIGTRKYIEILYTQLFQAIIRAGRMHASRFRIDCHCFPLLLEMSLLVKSVFKLI